MTARGRSLQGRLLALVLGVVVALGVGVLVTTWLEVRHELDELLDSHLAQAAALLVVQQVRELEIEDDRHDGHKSGRDDRALDAPSLHRYAPQVAFQVFHEDELVLRSSNAPERPLDPRMHERRPQFRTVTIDGQAWRVFSAFGADRDVRVLVGEQVASRQAILWAVLRGTALPALLALPVLALALWLAVYRGMAPLRRLSALIATRPPQATGPMALPDAPRELQPVLEALNGLFDRIAALVESERRFTADAAHELRTPIAAIRAQAQVAMGDDDDPAGRRHALQALLVGCDRAARLVDQLLTLSRLEAGEAPALQALDLAGLARQLAAEAAGAAIDRQQTLALQADGPVTVRGEPTLVAVLLRNLVDNALRYSPTGATVQVTLSNHSGRVRLVVEDSGPGLPPASLARLGERFFRELGTGHGGSGLGWSIVRRIAAVHGAQVQAGRSAALGGLAVTVDWPAG